MNRSFSCIPQKQQKGASFLGNAFIYLLLVAFLHYPAPSYSADGWPPIVSRDYVKGLFHGMLMLLFEASTGAPDDPLKSQLLGCMIPSINAAVNKSFPAGVNSLDAATFKQRIDLKKILEIATSGDAEKCIKEFKQNIEQSKQAPASNQIPLMDLDDLRTDIASLQGRKIRVKAEGHYVMNMFMLKKGAMDTSPLFIDITKLNRDQRRRVLQQCNDLITGCRVTIYGTVDKVNYQMGITAENIEFQ